MTCFPQLTRPRPFLSPRLPRPCRGLQGLRTARGGSRGHLGAGAWSGQAPGRGRGREGAGVAGGPLGEHTDFTEETRPSTERTPGAHGAKAVAGAPAQLRGKPCAVRAGGAGHTHSSAQTPREDRNLSVKDKSNQIFEMLSQTGL